MREFLKSLFDNPDREAKRLNRDAATVIDSATRSIPVDRIREIALMTLQRLGEVREHLDKHTQSHDQVLYRFQQLHGEARRRMDQVGLTAYTLVIIHLRAEALGDIATPALEAIDDFIGRWAHAAEEQQRAPAR
ncbi:MAG: hypothetical protein BMS9Abin14_672 [Gammaproteobacteria bacterium]|nr:MAG: hypothetical protein BMS9Abin14_672 [Gammaproteobacteria bacterium]